MANPSCCRSPLARKENVRLGVGNVDKASSGMQVGRVQMDMLDALFMRAEVDAVLIVAERDLYGRHGCPIGGGVYLSQEDAMAATANMHLVRVSYAPIRPLRGT